MIVQTVRFKFNFWFKKQTAVYIDFNYPDHISSPKPQKPRTRAQIDNKFTDDKLRSATTRNLRPSFQATRSQRPVCLLRRGRRLKRDSPENLQCKYEEVDTDGREMRSIISWQRWEQMSHPTALPAYPASGFPLGVTLVFSSTDVLWFLQYYCYRYLTRRRLLSGADKEVRGQRLKLNSAQMWHWWSGFHTSRNCLYHTSCPRLLKMPCLRRQSPVISHLNNTIGKANSPLGLFIYAMRKALKPVIMRLCLFA